MTINDTAALVRELRDLATRLKPEDQAAEQRLNQLGDALEHGTLAQIWAGRDIGQLLDTQQLAERLRQRRAADNIVFISDVVRNALIFVPIILTWLGIESAVSSYSDLLAAEPARREEPFLYLWQTGFYGYQRGFGLQGIAWMLFALLGLVIVLTVLSMLRSNTLQLRAVAETAELVLRIEAALVRTAHELRQRVQPDFAIATREIERIGRTLIEQLAGERERISALAQTRENELVSFTAFTERLENSTQNLVAAANTIEQSYRDLSGSMSGLQTAVGTLGSTADLLKSETEQLLAPLRLLVTDQQRIGETITQTLAAVTTAVTETAAATAQSVAITERSVQQQQDFITAAQQDRTAQQAIAEQLNAAAQQLDGTAGQFGSHTQALTADVQLLQQAVTELVTPVAELTRHTTELVGGQTQTVGALREITKAQQQSAGQVAQLLTSLKTSDERLTATSASLAVHATALQDLYGRVVDSRDDILGRLAQRLDEDAALGGEAAAAALELHAISATLRDVMQTVVASIEELAQRRAADEAVRVGA